MLASSARDDGEYETSLAFTGAGFARTKTCRFTKAASAPLSWLASATADSTGSFTAAASAPQSDYGARVFVGAGQSSGKLGAARFSMGPRLVLNPDSGPNGSEVTVEGYGFGPFEKVKVYWNNPRTLLHTVTADVYGSFDGSAGHRIKVPATAPPGTYTVSAHGQTTRARARASFIVE